MKFSKRFFLILSLVALLTAALSTTAFAANMRVVRYANVSQIKVLGTQPATFRLLGSYTCDKLQLNASVSGKIITIYAYDAKVRYTGQGCDHSTPFKRDMSIGTLVPGVYTILVNPDENGRGQKTLKGFIAPMLPTSSSTGAPVQ